MQGGERERASEREREEKGRNGGTERERRWKGGRERGGRVVVTCCFTSSQPVRLYQGDGGRQTCCHN